MPRIQARLEFSTREAFKDVYESYANREGYIVEDFRHEQREGKLGVVTLFVRPMTPEEREAYQEARSLEDPVQKILKKLEAQTRLIESLRQKIEDLEAPAPLPAPPVEKEDVKPHVLSEYEQDVGVDADGFLVTMEEDAYEEAPQTQGPELTAAQIAAGMTPRDLRNNVVQETPAVEEPPPRPGPDASIDEIIAWKKNPKVIAWQEAQEPDLFANVPEDEFVRID